MIFQLSGLTRSLTASFGTRRETPRRIRALRPVLDGMERRLCLTASSSDPFQNLFDNLAVGADESNLARDVASAESQQSSILSTVISRQASLVTKDFSVNSPNLNQDTVVLIQDMIIEAEVVNAFHFPAGSAVLGNSQVNSDITKLGTDTHKALTDLGNSATSTGGGNGSITGVGTGELGELAADATQYGEFYSALYG
jgi:hypothetical protein